MPDSDLQGPEKCAFGGVHQKKGQRLLRFRDCVIHCPFNCQARVHIHNFTEVNFWNFVVEPLCAVVTKPSLGTSALSHKHNSL